MKNIVNIINFVRGIEPREGRNIDLVLPVREQIRLSRENNIRGTFLLQYDALIDPVFINLMKSCEDICEIGLWLEIVQPQVEKIGEEWNGRFPWDWHNDVGFLIGYEPDVRIRLVDEAMEQFKKTFGYYPKSVGSWHIDAVSMKHISEKYNVKACCICRDQVGTDGYTIQGGYYNQAYYPSVNNMLCPANSDETQINMPVFRMLGSDSIYAYDYQTMKYGIEKIPSLEPVAQYGGSKPNWVDWFFNETFCGAGISMQYTQAGQENSFGWPKMGKGLEYQYPLIKRLTDEGKVEVLTLSESGEWYMDNFKSTPPSTIIALSDWHDDLRKSVWFSCKFYRANLFWDDGIVRFRDVYIFNDEYPEKYLKTRCQTHACEFRNLPVMDGTLYSDTANDIIAGVYFSSGNKPIKWQNHTYIEDNKTATVKLTADSIYATVTFTESSIVIDSNVKDFSLTSVYSRKNVLGDVTTANATFANKNNGQTVITYINKANVKDNVLAFEFDSVKYGIEVKKGIAKSDFSIASDSGKIELNILKHLF